MLRIGGYLTALALALGAVSAGADTPRRAVFGEACPVDLPDWASPPERFAWAQICAGKVADMQLATGADDGAGCDATAEDQPWPDSRLLSPRFVQLVTAREPWISAPVRPAVRIRCARIDGPVLLNEEVVPQSLWIDDSRLLDGASAAGASLGRDLSFRGSRFSGPFTADGLSVGGGVFLRDGAEFAEVNLAGAKVGGNLEASGSRFSGLFAADGLSVGGDVFLSDGAEFAEVRLLGATVVGDIYADGSRFSGLFNADRLSVSGGVFLQDGAEFTEMRLLGAEVGGDLAVDGSRFSGLFNANNLSVDGSVYMRDGAEFTEVRLLGAKVGGNLEASGSRITRLFAADNLFVGGGVFLRDGAEFAGLDLNGAKVEGGLQMQGSRFDGLVQLTGASVGELTLWQGAGTDPVWGAAAQLILRNVQAGALQARMPESWRRADGSALPVDLQGFRYDRLGGLRSGAEGDLAVIGDATALIGWIEGPTPAGPRGADHAPQPYFQMESVLRDMGAGRAADQVAYARHLDRLDSLGPGIWGWLDWAGEQVWRGIVGFGVYPFRVLWWVAGLIAVGTLMARRTGVLCDAGWWDCFWYSVENTLPLIEPSGDNRAISHLDRITRGFFHFQKIAGFALATILVGALTLMGS